VYFAWLCIILALFYSWLCGFGILVKCFFFTAGFAAVQKKSCFIVLHGFSLFVMFFHGFVS